MIDAIGTALAAFVKEHPVVTLLLLARSSLGFIEWSFGTFVTFTHRMRLHYRRMRSEPNPHLVDN